MSYTRSGRDGLSGFWDFLPGEQDDEEKARLAQEATNRKIAEQKAQSKHEAAIRATIKPVYGPPVPDDYVWPDDKKKDEPPKDWTKILFIAGGIAIFGGGIIYINQRSAKGNKQ